MVSTINDLDSISQFIELLFPNTRIAKMNAPEKPQPNNFVIRFQNSDSAKADSVSTYQKEREFQIVYYGSDGEDTLEKMDEIERKVNNEMLIPIKDSLRYMRVEGFSFSAPFQTKSGVDVVISVLETSIREAKDQKTYEKIEEIFYKVQKN